MMMKKRGTFYGLQSRICSVYCGPACPAGQVTYHKMFGDYGVYLDGKMFALVCDDQLFIKITKEGAALAPQLPKAPPYDGAKDYFLYEDVDDREHMIAFVQAHLPRTAHAKAQKEERSDLTNAV